MGKLISLSGVDNSGKSTQSRLLLKYWKEKKKKVKATEFAFGYFLLKPFIGFLRKATDSPKTGPVKRNNNPLFKLWFIPAFFDIWIGYFLHLRKLKNKYDLVLCDRFYTDIWVNLLYYGYLPNWAFNTFVKLLPKADIALMLNATPETTLQREREFTETYYEDQIKIYQRLGKQINIYIVDANKSVTHTFKQIISYIENHEDIA